MGGCVHCAELLQRQPILYNPRCSFLQGRCSSVVSCFHRLLYGSSLGVYCRPNLFDRCSFKSLAVYLVPNLSFNPDPTVLDFRHALDFRLSVGPVNFVR